MQTKLSGIISGDFDMSGKLLIVYSVFVKYLRKNGKIMGQTIIYLEASRKSMIQLGARSCIIFSLSLVSL
jgi:hypothetical protein